MKTSSSGVLWIIFVVPIAYVLSVGPAAAIVQKSPHSYASIIMEKVYAPIIWLHDHTSSRDRLRFMSSFGE